jgi:hypothetical protein
MSTMTLGKLKMALVFVAAVGLFGVGGGLFLGRGEARLDPLPVGYKKSAVAQVSTPAPAPTPRVDPPVPEPARHADLELHDLLTRTTRYDGCDDPKATLQDLLDQFRLKYQIEYDVNEQAFPLEAAKSLLKKEIASPPLPAMTVSVGTVVNKLLARLPRELEVTYVIRDDRIEITSAEWLRGELGLPARAPLPPLVYEHFEETPVLQALDKIAKSSGLNVVVDPSAAQRCKEQHFTAWLRNVPAETAVRAVAAGLNSPVVRMGNVLYVANDEIQAEALDKSFRSSQDPKAPKSFSTNKSS